MRLLVMECHAVTSSDSPVCTGNVGLATGPMKALKCKPSAQYSMHDTPPCHAHTLRMDVTCITHMRDIE